MKKLLLLLLALMLTSCTTDELRGIADSARDTIESEIDRAKDSLDNLPDASDILDIARNYAYDSRTYDRLKNFEQDIRNQTIVSIPLQEGSADINLNSITDAIATANRLQSQFTSEFRESGEEQVKEIERTVTIDITDRNPVTAFNLSRDLGAADTDIINVKSGDVQIGFTPQMLQQEFQQHQSINVVIDSGGGSYNIIFEDENGNEIKLLNNAVISIEARRLRDNSVVYDQSDDEIDLIGGRLDDGAITFQTKEGGDYVIDTNNVRYNDIGNEDKETQEAIIALATKGIFNTESSEFNPQGMVSRAEAVTMVTKTLYKYDEDFTAGFLDVDESEWYYTAVASGVAESIVQGYPDNTFRPYNVISKQELLTIAANTLVADRKFLLPEDPSLYVGGFEDEIAGWAVPNVAMTVRDGVITQEDAGNGYGEITRAQAALILYNLFERL